MLEGYEFICFGDDYNRVPTTIQRIAKELSRKNKVLWINSLGERKIIFSMKSLRRVLQKISSFGTKRHCSENDKVIVFMPLAVPLAYNWRMLRTLNTKFILFQLRWIMKKVNIKEPIVMTGVRGVFDIIEALPKKVLVYFCMDYYKGLYRDSDSFLEQAEKIIMASADIIFVTSKNLVDHVKGYGRIIIEYIGQGVDFETFSPVQENIEIPQEMTDMKKPIIGFLGTLDHWVDLELIRQIALSRPQWSIVLIGRRDMNIDVLNEVGNIHYLGFKRREVLAGYFKAFDCAIIPFNVDATTRCIYPMKALEYLASGKPIVSTYLPDLEGMGELIYFAHTLEEFIMGIEEAIREDSQELIAKRLKYSLRFTWANRAELVSATIERILKNRSLR